jgi:cell division protein ZipA
VIGRSRDARWQPLEEVADHASASALALTWELAALLSPDWTDAARDLASFAAEAGRTAAPLGWSVAPREAPAEAAQRAVRLIALKDRFARSVEMRLLPQGRRFPARDVWRAAYALGMEWGDMDLFHWRETRSGKRLFTLSAVGGGTTYFLPERAAEGEAVAGLALSFELPLSPAPLATYDRMAVALDYLRQKLGGRPTAPDGAELDGDRLWSDRDALTDAVEEMTRAGIAPGSPEAARFF